MNVSREGGDMLWNSGLWVCGKEEAKAYLLRGWFLPHVLGASAQPMRNQPP